MYTDLSANLSICCPTPKRKGPHTAGSLFWTGGPRVCKASLRADGSKPLWLYSQRQQTLNQVECRQHGNTINCMFKSCRNSSLHIATPDQYTAALLLCCVGEVNTGFSFVVVRASWGLAQWGSWTKGLFPFHNFLSSLLPWKVTSILCWSAAQWFPVESQTNIIFTHWAALIS